jgi:hypothetical protein
VRPKCSSSANVRKISMSRSSMDNPHVMDLCPNLTLIRC